ncbi:MAG: hypothetical protein IJ764_06135, partial [Bacteroidales bacterium]|nr:hypothetical protein [Bacteroidales bacterium]
ARRQLGLQCEVLSGVQSPRLRPLLPRQRLRPPPGPAPIVCPNSKRETSTASSLVIFDDVERRDHGVGAASPTE